MGGGGILFRPSHVLGLTADSYATQAAVRQGVMEGIESPITAADKTRNWVMSIPRPARPWHGLVQRLCASLNHRTYLQREKR
jgi:hypothetical protein